MGFGKLGRIELRTGPSGQNILSPGSGSGEARQVEQTGAVIGRAGLDFPDQFAGLAACGIGGAAVPVPGGGEGGGRRERAAGQEQQQEEENEGSGGGKAVHGGRV